MKAETKTQMKNKKTYAQNFFYLGILLFTWNLVAQSPVMSSGLKEEESLDAPATERLQDEAEDIPPPPPAPSVPAANTSTNTAPLPTPRARNNTNTSAGTNTSGATGTTRSGLPKLNMGSYVELDDSLKNEPFEGTIDYPDAELTEILNAISKLAQKNFILDSSLKGKRITILSPQKVTKEEAYNVFLTALYMNGLTLVSSGKFLRVIPSREAPKSNVRVFYGDFVPASDEIVTLVFPLKNISSEDMPRIFQDLLPRTGNILVYPETNSVVMTDSGLNLRRMISILKSVDVPGSQPKLENIPINYASAKDIAKLIDEILEAQTGGTAARRPTARNQREKKIQGGGVITKIVPDDRTNSLVVLANGKGIEQLRSLVAKLDTPNASNSGNIHIYFIKNAVAEELAATLNNLLGSGGSTSSAPARDTPVPTNPRVPVAAAPTRATNVGASLAGVALEGQIKVVADKPTNSLVVRASAANYGALKKILERLDIPRRQVNVEATIMEIRITEKDVLNVAANIAVPGQATAGGFIPTTMDPKLFAAAVASPAALNGLIAGLPLGRDVTVTNPADPSKNITIKSFIGLIQAIQGLSLGQILQQPNILTSDNEPGTVNITEKIKVIGKTTTQFVQDQAVTTQETDTVPVELELKVTPQIGADNELVKLKVEQTMEDFNKSVNAPNQIDTVRRRATTVVVVRDGDTVVIGGLEKNDVKAQKSKVPLLGDLPIIGTLFRGSDTEKTRSNLMLFLTPKIIDDNDRLLEFTQQQLQRRREVGKEAYDPKDFHRKDVSKLLKDTDERLKGKRSWGFKKNQSAYLSDDVRQERPKASSEDSRLSEDAMGGEEQGIDSSSDLLPAPADFDSADGLETLDIQ